jgi:hypothetical protein
VFPKRRGDGAGAHGRKRSSHAKAFRRDLRRVFGIDIWNAEAGGFERAENRELTARELVLLDETEYSLPVDFHSWRRAYNQALADAGVNAQTSMALAGHSSLAAHEKYLRSCEKSRTMPLDALPQAALIIGHNRLGTRSEVLQEAANSNEAPDDEISMKAAGSSYEPGFTRRMSSVQARSRLLEKSLPDAWSGGRYDRRCQPFSWPPWPQDGRSAALPWTESTTSYSAAPR